MYHIKNDTRCMRSAKKISKAFKDLMDNKPLSEISISDIQRSSGVGRATFYRLFDNIDDVLLFTAEEELHHLAYLYKEMSMDEFTERFLSGIISGTQDLRNIMESGKLHIISKALRTNLTNEAIKQQREPDDTSAYIIAIFVGSCISLVTAWDENGRKESVEELARIMKKTINYRVIETLSVMIR